MLKKIPMRTCVVTKEKLPKNELLRVVMYDGEIKVDMTGKMNGHGCYLKKSKEVVEVARNKKILNRIFDQNVDDQIYDEILNVIENN